MTHVPGWGSWTFNPIVIARAAVGGVDLHAGLPARRLALGGDRRGPLDPVHVRPAGARGRAALAAGPDRGQVPALGAHGPARAALRHRPGAADPRPAPPAAPAGPLARGAARGRAERRALRPRARADHLAVGRDPAVGDRDVGVGDPGVFDYATQHEVVHAFEHATLFYTGLGAVVADHRPAAARALAARRRSASRCWASRVSRAPRCACR